jgi:hypothetical protein
MCDQAGTVSVKATLMIGNGIPFSFKRQEKQLHSIH